MTRWPGRLLALISGLCLCLASLPASAQVGLPIVPTLTGHVVDTSNTLDVTQQQTIEAKLTAFEAATGSQLVVLMVPTTQPEDIASYANRVGNSWKLGRKDIGDGLLLIVAKNDRKLRIEVAKSLEGAVPDLAAKHIIDEAITPRFKQGDYAGGVDAGVDQLMTRIKGEALPIPQQAPTGASSANEGFQWMDLAVFLFFAVPIGGGLARQVLGNKLGSLLTGGLVGGAVMLVTASIALAVLAGVVALVATLLLSLGRAFQSAAPSRGRGSIVTSGGWGSSDSSGSFGGGSGGGFSSGGGGDFGGGGASGDW